MMLLLCIFTVFNRFFSGLSVFGNLLDTLHRRFPLIREQVGTGSLTGRLRAFLLSLFTKLEYNYKLVVLV